MGYFTPAAVFGCGYRSVFEPSEISHVAMTLTGLLHALWPVLPPNALIWIRYDLPGVVG